MEAQNVVREFTVRIFIFAVACFSVSHQKLFHHFLFAFSLVQPNIFSFILQFEDTVVTTVIGYWSVLGMNVSINGVIVLNVR